MSLIPHSRGGALLRFALGALIVIAFTATTTAVAGLLQFKQLATYISATPALKLKRTVTVPNPGDPQTILVIGSDHRAGTSWSSANTDTMMLIRMNPNSATINVLSVPRDLEVQVPAVGTAKLNSAYSQGGPNLLVQILQQQVFQGLQVNHVVDINFGGFEDLVNAIGCVYTDVDHRYYNNTAVTDYSSINILPGYQKLCGAQALSFVRFRHTDTDIVRNARQQDFVRWAKEQYSQDQLIENRSTLLKIFGQHAQTDENLHTTDGLINLFDLVAFMDGHTIKQIPFPAIILPCNPSGAGTSTGTGQTVTNSTQSPCYVTANASDEQAAYDKFMTPTVSQPSSGAPSSSAGASSRAGSAPQTHAPSPASLGLTADVSDGKAQAAAVRKVGMPVYYPRFIQNQSQYCTAGNTACPMGDYNTAAADGVPSGYPRGYVIRDQQGNPHAAYRMTLVINSLDGQYYGIQGTTWQHPPLLQKPTGTRTVDGKQLLIYNNGGSVTQVAWRTPEGVYWVSNTLTNNLSNAQMVAIAASLTQAG
jgi:polyisoprenyl-teichoic acid--peptidoglycan teichoic acid transferase